MLRDGVRPHAADQRPQGPRSLDARVLDRARRRGRARRSGGGETAKEGGYITSSKAYTFEDYAATIYAKLGIDTTEPLHAPAGRPIYPGRDGHAIPELM